MLCLGLDHTGKARCEGVVEQLEIPSVSPRWINGLVSVEQSPELRHVLGRRNSTNFVVDHEGTIIRSNISPRLVTETLDETTR